MRCLIAVLLLGISAFAQSTPITSDPRVVQYFCCSWNRIETFDYDAASDRFSYLAVGPVERLVATPDGNVDFAALNSVFSWSVGVDENGRVTDPGSMLWFMDFGRGLELLASGYVKSEFVQIETISHYPDWDEWTFANWELEFVNDYFNAPIAMGGELRLELEIFVASNFDSPFKADFGCSVPEPACKGHPSSTGVHSIRVSEPGSMGLALGLGILLLAVARWRRGASKRDVTLTS